jgi:succinyl-CoA synthetase beta subunit
LVSKVLIAQDVYYPGESEVEEFYMSVLLDREKGKNVIVYSTEGGMDIEHVAENTPEKIYRELIDPRVGIQGFQARKIAFNLGLSGEAFKQMVKFIPTLYKAYEGIDASMFEINPLFKTSDNKIIAVDAKVSLDGNGLFRHPDYEAMRDKSEEDPTEVEADEVGLNFVKLDGNVGCMVNGAGLAMATMDIIKLSGGNPANFLDVGGTANAERVEKAFHIILKDPNVKAILINIFGGIVRCDRVAQGIVDAYKNIGEIPVPIIVRLQGTNAIEAKKIIEDSGLNVHSVVLLQEAADLVKEVLAN